MDRLTVVPVIPLALSDARKTAMFATSSSAMTRRVCVVLAKYPVNCSLLRRVVRYPSGDSDTAAPPDWAPAGRPVRPLAGVCTRWKCGKVGDEGEASVELAADELISRARAGDGDAFRE